MRVEVLVDSEQFWPRLRADISSAQDSVFIQTLSFEGDSVGKGLAHAVKSCRAPDRRIVADEFHTKHRINDLFVHHPKHWFNADLRRECAETLAMVRDLGSNGVPVRLTNTSGPLHWRAYARNHKKLMVIDDRIAYVGGLNFSEHNFAWHDMMLRIEDVDVARFLKDDFLATWEGRHLASTGEFPGIAIHRFDGRTNPTSFVPILDLIGAARDSVYVTSPYITWPFLERLDQAKRNGADVTLLTPDHNNCPLLKHYVLWNSSRSGFEVRLYPERMSHLKAMLIDDAHLIVGSTNFSLLSMLFMQELVLIITDEGVIAQFDDLVRGPDLRMSKPAGFSTSRLQQLYDRARFTGLAGFLCFTFRIRSLR